MWGIGRETADSILLYAFRKPVFVVDAYTRRFLQRLGLIGGKESYDLIQEIFHEGLPRKHALYNEMHALVVEHAKRHCRAKPECAGCPVTRSCRYHLSSRPMVSRRLSSA
jgi:endonuclease-3 related protein